jgi:hypothetical protein
MVYGKVDSGRLKALASSLRAEMERLNVEYISVRVDLSDEEIEMLYAVYKIRSNRIPLGHIKFDRFLEVGAK